MAATTTTARDANTLMAAANDARRLDESTLQRGRAAEERRAVEEDFLFYTPYCPDLVAGKMAVFCIIRIILYYGIVICIMCIVLQFRMGRVKNARVWGSA